MAHLRAGRCMYLRHTYATALKLWKIPTIDQSVLCEHCRVEDTALHLATCTSPIRREPRDALLSTWVTPVGITQPSSMEILAVLVGEAPHHCDRLQLPESRMRSWRELFHFVNGGKLDFYAQLSACLTKMLSLHKPSLMRQTSTTVTSSNPEPIHSAMETERPLVQQTIAFPALIDTMQDEDESDLVMDQDMAPVAHLIDNGVVVDNSLLDDDSSLAEVWMSDDSSNSESGSAMADVSSEGDDEEWTPRQ